MKRSQEHDDKNYELLFIWYGGSATQIDEGSYEEMRARAAKRIRKHRKEQRYVDVLKRGWVWELCEGDDDESIGFDVGFLKIRCTTPVREEEDGCDFEEAEDLPNPDAGDLPDYWRY